MIKVKNLVFIVIMFSLLIAAWIMVATKKPFGIDEEVIIGKVILSPAKAQGYNESLRALNQSRTELQELVDAGFNVLRINDTLSQAEQLFAAQSALMKESGVADFSLILERTAEIAELKKQAEEMNDELNALEARLKEIGFESEAYGIFNKAKKEFVDERYDKVSDLVEEAYVKVSEEEALQTRFRAIYVAGTKTIADFFKKRWKELTFTIIFIIVAYLFLRKRVAIFLINRKINNLNFEKEILEKLIKKAQYEYFHLFKIPEELYHIRIEKFGELIRDIDRQIPLLLEEKEKIRGKAKEKEVKPEKIKKFHKRLIIIATILLIFIALGIFLTIYFKVISYSEILEFIQKIGFDIKEGFNSIIGRFGVIVLLISGIVFLAILSVTIVLVYRCKKRKKEKPEIEKEKRFKFLQPLQIFISNKIHRLKLYIKHLIERIENKRQYRKLLKEKKKEELPRLRYLRKQKIILFKRNLQQKINSLLHIGFVKTEEEKEALKRERQLQKEIKLQEKESKARLKEEKVAAGKKKSFDFSQSPGLVKTEKEKESLDRENKGKGSLKRSLKKKKKKEEGGKGGKAREKKKEEEGKEARGKKRKNRKPSN